MSSVWRTIHRAGGAGDGDCDATPWFIASGETYSVEENLQALWTHPIELEDETSSLDASGVLCEVQDDVTGYPACNDIYYFVPSGETFTVPNDSNIYNLWSVPIELEDETSSIDAPGILVEVS